MKQRAALLLVLMLPSMLNAAQGRVELSARYLNHDADHFGQYSDQFEQGGDGVLELEISGMLGQADWYLEGDGLGLETYDFVAGFRQSGFQVELTLDGILQFRESAGRTPFSTTGNSLQLPANWVAGSSTSDFSALPDALHRFDEFTERDAAAVRLSYAPNDRWLIETGYEIEQSKDTRSTGGTVYFDASTAFGALLPLTEEHERRSLTLAARYTSDTITASLNWRRTAFDNERRLTTWQVPFSGIGDPRVSYPLGTAGVSTAPGHDDESLTLQAAINPAAVPGLNIQWQLHTADSQLDEALLPYSANPALRFAPVPGDFHHRVRQRGARLNLLYRSAGWRRLTLRAHASWHERDQRQSQHSWRYVRGDAVDQGSALQGYFANAYDYDRSVSGVGMDYRLPWWRGRLAIDFDRETVERRRVSVAETEADRWRGVLRFTPLDGLQLRTTVDYSDRDYDRYQWQNAFLFNRSVALIDATPEELRYDNHPLFSQYHLAARESAKARMSLSWHGWSNWLMTLNVNVERSDYDRTVLGLVDAESRFISLDLNYDPTDKLSAFVHASTGRLEGTTRGRSFGGGIEKAAGRTVPPLPQASDPQQNWQVDTRDRVRTFSAGLHWQPGPRWQLETAWSEVRSDAHWGAAFDDLPMPAVETRLSQLSISVAREVTPRLALQAAYEYYAYRDDDWALKGVGVTSLSNYLLTGEQPDDEQVNVVALTLRYRFGDQ